jgi:hypothetical protein
MHKQLKNPYKGPFPFISEDEDRFFGRKKETAEIVRMIDSCQLTVLFGNSGTGKTSLIQAKLLPQLRREYFHPIYIRINFESADPLLVTKGRIMEELKKWEPGLSDFGENQSLIDFAANNGIHRGLVKPVLFFDQFEELFTLGPKNDPMLISRFMRQLADLIELRLPDELKQRDKYNNLVNFKVVFSLRQDWIAYLEDYSNSIPSILLNRYRLKRFSASQAQEAIYKPATAFLTKETANHIIRKIGIPTLWEDASEQQESIQDDLSNLSVDPFVLSLYCFELFEKTCAKGIAEITCEMVDENNHLKLIREYYDKHTQPFKDLKGRIEDCLINESGKRLIMNFDSFAATKQIKEDAIELAKISGILRITGESPSWEVEIVHDQLAIQIFESRTEKIRANAIRSEREALRLKQSAKKAKVVTFCIITFFFIVSAIVAVIVNRKLSDAYREMKKVKTMAAQTKASADSLIKVAKEDNTIIGLKKQLANYALENQLYKTRFSSLPVNFQQQSHTDSNYVSDLIHQIQIGKEELHNKDLYISKLSSEKNAKEKIIDAYEDSLNKQFNTLSQLRTTINGINKAPEVKNCTLLIRYEDDRIPYNLDNGLQTIYVSNISALEQMTISQTIDIGNTQNVKMSPCLIHPGAAGDVFFDLQVYPNQSISTGTSKTSRTFNPKKNKFEYGDYIYRLIFSNGYVIEKKFRIIHT